MRTHVEFRSDKFPAYEGEEEQINPDVWGQRLAEYLRDKLLCAGIQAGEFYAEDWGWEIPVTNKAFPIFVGCGHFQDEDGYLIQISPSKPVIRKFLKTIDTTEDVGRVADTIDCALNSDPDIREVRWWSDTD